MWIKQELPLFASYENNLIWPLDHRPNCLSNSFANIICLNVIRLVVRRIDDFKDQDSDEKNDSPREKDCSSFQVEVRNLRILIDFSIFFLGV